MGITCEKERNDNKRKTGRVIQEKNREIEGLSYTSKSKKLISARRLKAPCSEKCRIQCYKKFTEEQSEAIFSSY